MAEFWQLTFPMPGNSENAAQRAEQGGGMDCILQIRSVCPETSTAQCVLPQRQQHACKWGRL